MSTVEVRVDFRLRGRRWARRFTLPQGSTVRQLKEALVRPHGAREDAGCFAFLRAGQLLFDAERLEEDLRLDFRFVGRADPPRKLGERASEEARPGRESEAAGALAWVDVAVRHARPELESQVAVRVPESATGLAVRLAVLQALGERRLDEVHLVAKKGDLLVPIPDSELIGTRRAFLATGRFLDGAPPAPQPPGASGADEPVLTKEHAMRLQGELLQGFGDASFQERLRAQGDKPGQRQALILSVQRSVLPRYGFEGSLRGVMMMLRAMQPFNTSPDFMALGMRIEMALAGRDVPAPSPRAASPDRGAPAADVQVVVELPAGGPAPTHSVSVPRGSTVRSVKQLLCGPDRVGEARPEDLRLCAAHAPERLLGEDQVVSGALARLRLLPVEPPVAGPPPPAEPPAEPLAQVPIEPQAETPGTPRTASRAFDFDVLDALDGCSDAAAGAPEEAAPEPEGRVSVTLTHAVNGSRMTLEVPETSTVLEVRRAAIEKLGDQRLANLKVVKKVKGTYVSEPSESLLNGRQELWTLGCALDCG